MKLEWSPYLAVGVTVIDDQHIELFSRFNGLLDALTEGNDKDEVAHVVEFLQDYVVTHFGMEEKVMDQYCYGGKSNHKAQHERFISDFASWREQLASSGFGKSTAVEMLQGIGEWLLNHVGKSDLDLGRFLRVAMSARKAA